MGLYHAILTILLLLVACQPAAAASRCLGCHQPHYAAQGGCRSCHLGNERTSRKALAHTGLVRSAYAAFALPHAPQVQAGARLAERLGCRRCHLLHGTGNRLATNLDSLYRQGVPDAIRTALTEPARSMPDFQLSPRDGDDLVTFILAGGLQQSPLAQSPPQLVHFNRQTATPQQAVFVRHCGGCHRLLSERDGGMGSGIAGPNLSGLFSRFYPGKTAWDETRLRQWLQNPRRTNPATLMRPVPLQPQEWQQLIATLRTP